MSHISRREPKEPEFAMKLKEEVFSMKILPLMNFCCVYSGWSLAPVTIR